jgi:ABC-type antimicrobial peptide transport system permease subunit
MTVLVDVTNLSGGGNLTALSTWPWPAALLPRARPLEMLAATTSWSASLVGRGGARRADVLRLVFREGMMWTPAGVALGPGETAAATRLMGAMLFGVSAWDRLAFAAGPVVLVIGALAGMWLPARRATAIDPLAALREP